MKNKFIVIFILSGLSCIMTGQSIYLPITKGASQYYNHKLYCFGLDSRKENSTLVVYQMDDALKIKDSLFIELGKVKAEEFLTLYSDTLHDFLNIYLQPAQKKEATILRIDKNFKKIALIEHVEMARLNNSSMFKNDYLYFKDQVFSLVTEGDSAKQHYLNKYDLKSSEHNFDYVFKWQFAFEKKDMEHVHVFYADENHVLLFVWRNSEGTRGQWLLKVNNKDGKLVKATKLNSKGENKQYEFGSFSRSSSDRSIILAGQKSTVAGGNSYNLADTKTGFANLYVLELDSNCEVKSRSDLKIPIIKETGAVTKEGTYLVQVNKVKKNSEQKLILETDIYRTSLSGKCFSFVNSVTFKLNFTDEEYSLEKNEIKVMHELESLTNTPDKLDLNGKLCDELGSFHNLFFSPPAFPIKMQFKPDSLNNTIWLLRKTEAKKHVLGYSYLKPVKNRYQLVPIESIDKSKNPALMIFNPKTFVITQQSEEKKYQIKLYNW